MDKKITHEIDAELKLMEMGRRGDVKELQTLIEDGFDTSYHLGAVFDGYYERGIHRPDFANLWLESWDDVEQCCTAIMTAVRIAANNALEKTCGVKKCFHSKILGFFLESGRLSPADILAAAIIAGDMKDVENRMKSFDAMSKRYTPSQLEPGLSGSLSKGRLMVLVEEYQKREMGSLSINSERGSNAAGRLLARHRKLIFVSTGCYDVANKDLQAIIERYNAEVWDV